MKIYRRDDMKKNIKMLLFLFLLIIVTGCESYKEANDDCQKVALQTLEERYGEEFVYVEDISDDSPCYGLVCYPLYYYLTPKSKDSPLYGQNIYVAVTEKREVYDNYTHLKYYQDVERVLNTIVQNHFHTFHLNYRKVDSDDDTNDFDKDTTLEEYLMNKDKRPLSITLEVTESEFKEELPKILLEEMSAKMQAFDMMIVVSKDEYFGQSTEDELRDQAVRNDFSKIAFYAKVESFEETRVEIYNQYGKLE